MISIIDRNSVQNRMSAHEPLRDKVVLLIGGTTVGGPSLAASLAERGADIAVVYFGDQHQRAQQIKEEVERTGQRCLTFPARPESEHFSDEVIGRVVEDLGRLDIFIDYTALPYAGLLGGNDDSELDETDQIINPFSNFEMMTAALGQITNGKDSRPDQPEPQSDTPSRPMQLVGDLIHKPVLSIAEGTHLGRIEDVYVDPTVQSVAALYLGHEGLLDRSRNLIPYDRVVTLGEDAVLVQTDDVIVKAKEFDPADTLIRRESLIGREIQTPGGTRLGRIGDIIVDETGQVSGFTLAETFVAGPIAEKKVIGRAAILEAIHDDEVVIANLSAAEEAEMKVVYDSLFGRPTLTRTNEDKR